MILVDVEGKIETHMSAEHDYAPDGLFNRTTVTVEVTVPPEQVASKCAQQFMSEDVTGETRLPGPRLVGQGICRRKACRRARKPPPAGRCTPAGL